ncbi:MAG: hypothetical protein Q8T08_13920, partial [Ignavibacteria bacterium]|nr:hypothetical protein [Ignavibacteria bacterium]
LNCKCYYVPIPKIQLAKRRARGYRNINNFINMIYFLNRKLKFDYPHYPLYTSHGYKMCF